MWGTSPRTAGGGGLRAMDLALPLKAAAVGAVPYLLGDLLKAAVALFAPGALPAGMRTLERYGARFLQRVFTAVEREKSERRANRAHSYARRYAAKEAGRNRVHAWFDTDITKRARHGEMQWATRLEQALAHSSRADRSRGASSGWKPALYLLAIILFLAVGAFGIALVLR